MESPLLIIFISFIILIVALIVYLIVRKTGLPPGKKCDSTADCATGLQCTGICSVPKYGSCSYAEDYCISGTKCNHGRCVVVITENVVGPPDEGFGPVVTATAPDVVPQPDCDRKCESPVIPCDEVVDALNVEEELFDVPTHSLYFTYTCGSGHLIYTGKIVSATYNNQRIYFITTEPNIIYVYNIETKSLESPLTHNLGQLGDLESTQSGTLYARKGTSIYSAQISKNINWIRLRLDGMEVFADSITTGPRREQIYFLNGDEIDTIYTDDPHITLIISENEVRIYRDDVLTQTVVRPNGQFPLYQNNSLTWTPYEYRYFTNGCKYVYIYITS